MQMTKSPAAQPQQSERPSAEIVGLQFGLATSNDFLGFSVIQRKSRDTLNNLIDPRLGLPAEDERCATCDGINYDECTGHFAHVKLTQPIFHPNHIRLVQRILQKICVACGVPKAKKKKTFIEEANNWKQSSWDIESEDVNGKGKQAAILEAEPIENDADGGIITLSSGEEEFQFGVIQIVPGPMDFLIRPVDFSTGSTRVAASSHLPQLGGSKSKGKAQANGSSYVEATTKSRKKSAGEKSLHSTKSPEIKSSGKIYKGKSAGLDVLNADTLRTANSMKTATCPHCSHGYPDYRPIVVKLLPVKGKKKGDVSQVLMLEVQLRKDETDVWLPDDFWAFLEGATFPEADVPRKYVLSAPEALAILRKIPESALGKLGLDRFVARPEGLIMKHVPIPPNCTRTTDYKYVNNTTAVRFGTDNVTRTLQNLVTEIGRIHRTRGGKTMKRGQRDESTSLQILTAEYLREKGAPKAVPGKEFLKKDRNGRVSKQDDHRWTKEWLSHNILAKGGSYTARAVIAGDPSLRLEEIGVPWEVAQQLTIPERVTQWNCTKLQDYVSRTQALLQESGKPGATRIERNGEAFQVLSNTTHIVQIGDVIHRNIQDGDYVYVNRPPSVHKHSLMAFKVHVHYGLVITLNPLVCAPFSADFDGDNFHIFLPQSLPAVAELENLMAVNQQIVSDHGGQPLLGLTQDTLLAAHLLTTSKLFVDKASMDQLCLWSSKQPPEAAIIKTPKGGPFWTGEQVFGLTLPEGLNLGSEDEGIFIQGGQITKWTAGTKMLSKDNEGFASALCDQIGAEGLVDYLNTAAGLLHAWLQVQGFSAGLTDFLVTNKPVERQKMLHSIVEEYYIKSTQESCDSVRILDAKAQAMSPEMISSPDGMTKNVRFLEQAAQEIFRARESEAERIVENYADKSNSLLLMVKSGSKGSRGKLLQQIAGMGLQLYKGRHLHSFSGSRRHAMSADPELDWWEDKGLVRSSFVDGLSPSELFTHVIADRTGILRKHVEVAQPGSLFKALMLFLRDLHVVYDGSVRSTHCGKNLVQFCYGGAFGIPVPRRSIWNQFGMDNPTTPMPERAEGPLTWEVDDRRRWPVSGLAGEPVGVLAATALSQPAYEVMLDAPNLNGPFKPRPLELVQETLYPREKSDLKRADRCVILRLVNCQCPNPLCLERRVLDVQAYLKRITLRTVAQSSAIEFWNMEDFRLAGSSGEVLRLGSPWLGHMKLSLDMMEQHQVGVEDIVKRLSRKFGETVKKPKKYPMGQIFFCYSHNCSISNGYCLHFSPRLPAKMQNEPNDDIYNAALLVLLTKIRATIIPGLLDCTVKGDERLESVRIVTEGPTWTTWHREIVSNRDLNEELVLEIVVSPTKAKSKRSMAWASVKEACLPIMYMLDWNRSMPYSIQEIRHALGVEAAFQMVERRLGLVLEKTAPHTHPVHVKLIADTMTYSGDANGFTFSGFQDMNKSTVVSAPFAEASFHKPIRTLLDAAETGAKDSVEGVMTSCVWGKEAPLGTGSHFDLFWQPSKDQRKVDILREAEKDVHAIWKDLDEKCIPDYVIPPSPTRLLPDLNTLPDGDVDLDDGAGFSPQRPSNGNDAHDIWGSSNQNSSGDGGAWGNSPVADEAGDGGSWCAAGRVSGGNGQPWGLDLNEFAAEKEEGGLGSSDKEKGMSGNTWDNRGTENTRGWSGAVETGNEGGWGDDGDGSGEDRSRPNEDDDNDGGKSKQSNQRSGENASNDLGRGWESTSNQGGGWDDVETVVPDEGGWDNISTDKAVYERSKKSTFTIESKGTTSGVAKNSEWGANPVQECGDGAWDSVPAEVADGDGWDSLARSPETGLRSDLEHTNHRQGSGAEEYPSEERHFTAHEENRGGERNWMSRGGSRGRGRGGFEIQDSGSTRSMTVSGANLTPVRVRHQFDKSHEAQTNTASDSGLTQEQQVTDAWGKPDPNCLSFPNTKTDVHEADGWDTVFLPENSDAAIQARATHPSFGAMPRTIRKPEVLESEFKEIDDLVKSMRRILFNPKNELGGRLSDRDDEAVKAVLAYHPNYSEKAGCGVGYIKVGKSSDFQVRCFWVVRTDGSEIDFSFHKCLKEKVEKELPSFVDWYSAKYLSSGRSLAPAANVAKEGRPADHQRDDTVAQAGEQSAPVIVIETRLADPQRKDTDTQAGREQSAILIDSSSD